MPDSYDPPPVMHLPAPPTARLLPALAAAWLLAAGLAAAAEPADPGPPQATPTPTATPSQPPPAAPAPSTPAAPGDDSPEETPPTEAAPEWPAEIAPPFTALLPRVGDYHRAALHVDPIEAAIARGDWAAPRAGDVVTNAAGAEAAWRAADTPRSSDLAGGYAYAEFEAPADGVLLLEAPGCAAVCVNGEWLPGDPYRVGWFRLPVEVHAGSNWLLAHLASPTARPRLVRPEGPAALLAGAATLPDLLATDTPGDDQPQSTEEAAEAPSLDFSLPLMNATLEPFTGCLARVRWDDGEPITTPLRRIESLLVTPLTLRAPAQPAGLKPGSTATLRVEILSAEADTEGALAEATLTLRVVGPHEPRTDTFVSAIDGSVQPYGVLPAASAEDAEREDQAGVLVTLHDAGQSHTERLAEHEPVAGVHVLAPEGRGRWAFDWEDWSRLDAMEALDDFQSRQAERGEPTDERRVALLGAGMGGHGALVLATRSPERFAAAGIVDGWLSFYTQGGALVTPTDASSTARMLDRQPAANDPLRVVENLRGVGVSLLHADPRGVSPSEGRYLRERLGEFHNDFAYREAPGAPPAELMRDQVAWLTSRRLADATRSDEIDFATPDPGVAATLGWATIVTAERQGEVARVRLKRDTKRREIVGSTDNVRRLTLSLAAFSGTGELAIRLDGRRPVKTTPRRDGSTLSLARDEEGTWRRTPNVGDAARFAGFFKSPERSGGFKSLFCCRPQLVYGTSGDADEKRWMAAKARYDAHLFLYRGAGRLEVLTDRAIRASLRGRRDTQRSVLLYGNAGANTAWTTLQRQAFFRRTRTVQVEKDRVWLGERPESGDDLAVLAVRPRPGSTRALIGVVGGTGEVGMRMTTRLRYFWSGIDYPDFLLFGPRAIEPPSDPARAPDVRAAGYFDVDWGVDGADTVWRDLAI